MGGGSGIAATTARSCRGVFGAMRTLLPTVNPIVDTTFSVGAPEAESTSTEVRGELVTRSPCTAVWSLANTATSVKLTPGVMAAITRPLAAAGVSVFAISPYSTDYLLIKEEQMDKALAALAASGLEVSV